jgi:hypothetical protein
MRRLRDCPPSVLAPVIGVLGSAFITTVGSILVALLT